MKIGIVGNGFVGHAVASFFQRHLYEVLVWDILEEKRNTTFPELLKSEIIFVCLPTLTNDDGTQDQKAIWEFIRSVAISSYGPLLVLKSTVLPGTTAQLVQTFPDLRFLFNPEFLTARTAEQDFANPTDIILGGGSSRGEQDDLHRVAQLFEHHFPNIPMLLTDYTTAEMIKYARNCFFAAKVAFFNDIAALCRETKVDYETVRKGVIASTWVNPMHTQVPGPDGKLGFGGACFPKDSKALTTFARRIGSEMPVLEAALSSNEKIRGKG